MDYDLSVIGAGWAGFNAALKAAKQGKKVCLIEEKDLGGTCLNRGCIPTKVFVQYSKQGLDLSSIQGKKKEIIKRLSQGMAYLLKSNSIDFIKGRARIDSSNSISVDDGARNITSDYILIASGSKPKDLPGLVFDHKRVISSDDILNLEEPVAKLLIVGGGVLGCEFAGVFQRLGSDVTLIEIESEILPGFDSEVAGKLRQMLVKSGIKVHTGKSFDEFDLNAYDKILLAAGRVPLTEGIWSEKVDIGVEKGHVTVDRELKTKTSNIYAAGDCIGGYMLAHVASYEGELASGNMFEDSKKRDYHAIPASVFTVPEASFIGVSEDEAKSFGVDYKVNSIHFLSVGMAHVLGDTRGIIKVIVDAKSGMVLGGAIAGLQASEMINTFSVIMKNNIPIQDVKDTIFAHPSVSEIISEIAKTFD